MLHSGSRQQGGQGPVVGGGRYSRLVYILVLVLYGDMGMGGRVAGGGVRKIP